MSVDGVSMVLQRDIAAVTSWLVWGGFPPLTTVLELSLFTRGLSQREELSFHMQCRQMRGEAHFG